MNYPDGTFRDYLKCLASYKYYEVAGVFLILGAIGGLILSLVQDASMIVGYIFLSAIGTLLACLLLRWIFARLYGVVLCFIGYPIFKICHNRAWKKEERRQQLLEKNSERAVEEVKQRFEEKLGKVADAVENEIEEYKLAFAKAAAEKAEHIKNHSAKINFHIKCGRCQNVFRGVQKP